MIIYSLNHYATRNQVESIIEFKLFTLCAGPASYRRVHFYLHLKLARTVLEKNKGSTANIQDGKRWLSKFWPYQTAQTQ
jgi:hypothetical protein